MTNLISPQDLVALWLTIKLAAISTFILLLIGIPSAWALARSNHVLKPLIETLITLPLVLPPTVIGFYLLISFSPDSRLAKMWHGIFNVDLAFSFHGLVIGSIIYSLPFVIQPLQRSFERIPQRTLLTAATFGAGFFDRFLFIVLPHARTAVIGSAALAFSHTIGEFGIVLMIGGNIPGETQVLSIALFDHVESSDYSSAHRLAALLLGLCFVLLLLVNTRERNRSASLT